MYMISHMISCTSDFIQEMFGMKSYTILYYEMLNTFHLKNIDKSYMICVLAPRLARQTQPARADAPLAVSAAQPTPQRLQGHERLCQLAFWAVQQWQCLAGTVRRPQSWHNEPQLLGKQGQDHAVSLARLGLCSSCSYGH